eukprot:5238547-Amphidinium_carterae.1
MDQRGARRAPAHQRGAQAQQQASQRATASSAIAPPTRTTTTASRTRSPRVREEIFGRDVWPRSNSPRRATALHPHLDDHPELYSDGTLSSNDSDITWEAESGEEEAREYDEVEGEARPRERLGRFVYRSEQRERREAREREREAGNPPVIVARDLPVEE